MMIIKGMQKLTLIDYPGKVACTLFTFGCNFRCPYCQNPELVIGTPDSAIEEKTILEFLEERKGFLDAVCITGGEPTLYEDLPEFIKKIKHIGYLVKLDTNGTNLNMLKRVVEENLIDYIAMDIKAPLERYEEVVRVEVNEEEIRRTTDFIMKCGLEYEFRTTVVPGLIGKEDIEKIGEWLEGAEKYCIQQFNNEKVLDPSFKQKKPYSRQELEELAEIARKYFQKVEIRGV